MSAKFPGGGGGGGAGPFLARSLINSVRRVLNLPKHDQLNGVTDKFTCCVLNFITHLAFTSEFEWITLYEYERKLLIHLLQSAAFCPALHVLIAYYMYL